MMIFLSSEFADVLYEHIGFFERFEIKLLLHVSQVFFGLPAVVATTVHDVLDDILVHHLELGLALFVKRIVLSFELFEISFCGRGSEQISWNNAVRLDGHEQAELSQGVGK
jgi:hypothetical protein